MLGFKLEVPHREDSLIEKIRPIYLDMQVQFVGICYMHDAKFYYRRLRPWTLECWML